MATFLVGSDFSVNIYAGNFSSLYNSTITIATSTQIRASITDNNHVDFFGSYTYNSAGQLTGGTLSEITETYADKTVYTISSFSVSMVQFLTWYVTNDNSAALSAILGGSDILIGGDFADTLDGGAGIDLLAGRGGDDNLYGSGGNDIISPDSGDDFISGGSGTDWLHYGGTGGGATIDMSSGKVYGGPEIGTDTFFSIERVTGSEGADAISGTSAGDRIAGGPGDDILYGNAGDDSLAGDAGADVMYGGAGTDYLDYSGGTTGMTLVMGSLGVASGQVFAGGDIGMDEFHDIEHVIGSAGTDVIGGDGNGNYFAGAGADDTIFGWTANDYLDGGTGDDLLFGQHDDDQLFGGDGDDALYGWAGFDRLTGGAGADRFVNTGAGESTDTITDYSFAEGDRVEVPGGGPGYTFTQTGSDVTVYDPAGNAIFILESYQVSDGFGFI